MVPDILILDVEQAFVDFHNSTFNLSMFGELTRTEIVSELFEYIVDGENAYGNVTEYARTMRELFANRHPEEDVKQFSDALIKFGGIVVDHLYGLGAYWPDRTLWYKFKEFCGDDIVLERATQEDFIN